jgi:hypothetical protein
MLGVGVEPKHQQSKLDLAANFCGMRKGKKLEKREPWPRIKRADNHGNAVFVVDARIKGKGES